ncbi:MAG: bifunctional isocitrate dehydrogenase kinase/phosphatase [Pseudomonadales bacterium]|nr:bifunctional isocitrate dehydrogenase kinase/phosphatase [Pseudomonadales bacterium]
MSIDVQHARQICERILSGFDDYRDRFRDITRGARVRFEQADWQGSQQAAMERIALYNAFTRRLLDELKDDLASIPVEDWPALKREYQTLIQRRPDFDLAETVFNTVFRKTWTGHFLNDSNAFVTEPIHGRRKTDMSLTRLFGPSYDLSKLLREVLDSYSFDVPWLDKEECVGLMVDVMRESIPLLRGAQEVSFEMLTPVFYRNKGAYLVGRMFLGEHDFPIAIPIHNDGEGAPGSLYVDTVIWTDSDLSIIFSFTRAYFMVDTDYPSALVDFLKQLLPKKKIWELYTSVGYYKHGKTEFYRGFLSHLEESDDQFRIAEGIKGLVMCVFTLPSYQVVFKVIKDRFAPTKSVTREQVREAYYLVKTHDRVGRMADTQEFTNFVFPRERFSEEVLTELLKVCASSVTLTEDEVIISHLYTERLMTPLNLYIDGKSDFELQQVMDEYGNAIKQLAAANIFPGDMLLKNFGVTRHGRVVFYDYDEICYLTDVNFREIPKSDHPEDQYGAEPWYSVEANDVFPEEFRTFLLNNAQLREVFSENHEDLYDIEFWKEMQDNIRNNKVMDVFPYRRKRRLTRNQNRIINQG